MDTQEFLKALEQRRTVYTLNDDMPASKEEVTKIVEHAVYHTPSAFNSQSARVVVLFGDDHKKLWDIAEEALRAVVPEENFEPTKQKLAGFRQAAGSILFFEDRRVIEGLQENFPQYADKFPSFSDQSSGMHQYAVWVALSLAGFGVNVQHYSPLIDEKVAQNWNIPNNWQLISQMVFGGKTAEAGEKEFAPIEDRFKVYGK